MPVPSEYQRIYDHLYKFLLDVRDLAEFGSTHQAYTISQSVFQVFRRRLTLKQAIMFSNVLNAGIRSLFVAEWDVNEALVEDWDYERIINEVKSLRADHNFADENSIKVVATALWANSDKEKLENVLSLFPKEAYLFWIERIDKSINLSDSKNHKTWELPGHIIW